MQLHPEKPQPIEYEEEYLKVFDELVELHKAAKLKLGHKKGKSKGWAVWLLLGRLLTLCLDALADAKTKREPSLWSSQRYATEVLDLIAYLNRKTTSRQFAIDWFDNKQIKAPRPRKRDRKAWQQEIVDASAYSADVGEHAWTYSAELNELLSASSMHPSYRSVKVSFLYSQNAKSLDMYDITHRSGSMVPVSYWIPIQSLDLTILGFFNSMNVLGYPPDAPERLHTTEQRVAEMRTKYYLYLVK